MGELLIAFVLLVRIYLDSKPFISFWRKRNKGNEILQKWIYNMKKMLQRLELKMKIDPGED